MDQQAREALSPSSSADLSHVQLHMNQQGPLSPSSTPYTNDASSSAGLGVASDQLHHQQHMHLQHRLSLTGMPTSPDSAFVHGNPSPVGAPVSLPFESPSRAQAANSYLSPILGDGDFSLFPSPGAHSEHLNSAVFDSSSLSPNDISGVASPQSHQSTTPSSLLLLEGHRPSSAQHSPSYNQHHQFASAAGGHSRNLSLGPEAALLSSNIGDWTRPQFQGHRRSPSEYSDVSSVSLSPNLMKSDVLDEIAGHSPLQQASDSSVYQEVMGMGTFSIADSSQGQHGRSPSRSPSVSPRIPPQQLSDMTNTPFGIGSSGLGDLSAYMGMDLSEESFPAVNPSSGTDVSQMAPPAINIDYAPNKPSSFELSKAHMDQDSLTPPDRGRLKSRPRAVTDPFHPGGPGLIRSNEEGGLSPSSASDLVTFRPGAARSLSPIERQAASSSRGRRQSTSAVPNNVIALRLADPEYQGSQDATATKRVQKHPATFQCTLCPKRFTRAYNLRSHLRTHTDERPFVCTVCGKAFARQHDRKRHESLHSGEKKFVCKGELTAGGMWGCGRRFARADALGRHFRSEAGRVCIKPLLDEEMAEQQRQWPEDRLQRPMAQAMTAPQHMTTDEYAMDATGHYTLPAALLAQYPALAQMSWGQGEGGGGLDDDVSGRSSFEASDYDEGDEGGYVSGSGTVFGDGSMNHDFGELSYGSDLAQ